jgi:predicted nucleic acid-binding Zn ribbon protein
MNDEHRIKDLIDSVLHDDNKLNKGFTDAQITNAWKKSVGEYVAQHTDKLFVRNQTLNVNVSNSILRQELHYKRSQICYVINGLLKKQVVSEIVIR